MKRKNFGKRLINSMEDGLNILKENNKINNYKKNKEKISNKISLIIFILLMILVLIVSIILYNQKITSSIQNTENDFDNRSHEIFLYRKDKNILADYINY